MALVDCFRRRAKITKVPFTPEQSVSTWHYMRKNYTDKGVPFDDIRSPDTGQIMEKGALSRTADDLGLPPEQIARMIRSNKQIRRITDDMHMKMLYRRQTLSAAQSVIRDLDTPQWVKTVEKVYNLPRAVLIFGHGGVFPWTHAGQSLLVPWEMGKWFHTEGRALSVMPPTRGSVSRYVTRMQDMQRLDTYDLQRMVTRSVDPSYVQPGIFGTKWFGGGRRAIDMVKIARSEMFDKLWKQNGLDKLEGQARIDAAKPLMQALEHATGVFMGKGVIHRNWLSRLIFAPQLLPARWSATIADPLRAVRTYGRYLNGTANPGEVAAAKFVAKRTAGSIATMYAILKLNDFINEKTGGSRVNFTDPSRGDWLRMKIAGHNLPLSFTFEPLRLAAQMIASGARPRTGESTLVASGRPLLYYIQQKLHPTPRLASEVLYGREPVTERVIEPFGPDFLSGKKAPFFKERLKEEPSISATQYWLEKGPIPVGTGTREFYHLLEEHGVPPKDAQEIISMIGKSAGHGLLGSLGPHPIHEREHYVGPPEKEITPLRRMRAERKRRHLERRGRKKGYYEVY